MFVYENQMEIRIKKLKPKLSKSKMISSGVEGGLERRDTAPIESARPKIRSVNDSILAFGLRFLSTRFNVCVFPWLYYVGFFSSSIAA